MTVVLVTGANSGIGTATVAKLVLRGAAVVATVRSDAAEDELWAGLGDHGSPGAEVVTVDRLDVTDAEQVSSVLRRHRPDVVVNNAGSALLGAVVDLDDDAVREQFEALVLGPVRLARMAIELGSCRRVVNVSSVVAEGVVPFTGWYAASKAALDTLSDVWRLELRPRDVQIVTVECGAVATDVWADAGDDVADGDDPSTATARTRWAELTGAAEGHFTDPDEVGAAVAGACLDHRPPAVIRVGFGSTLTPLARLVPRPVREALSAVVFGLRR